MEYGNLLSRAWNIIWKQKFLLVLGILAGLASGFGSGASGSGGASFQGDQPRFDLDLPWASYNGPDPLWIAVIAAIGLGVMLVFWVISTIARGGLVAGAGAADREEPTGFGPAWRAAWSRGWTLLGIGLVPALMSLVPLLLGALGLFFYTTGFSTEMGIAPARNVVIVGSILACLVLPVALILELLRAMAERACMLEGLGVMAAYGRAFRVVVDNLGSALVLFLIQIAVMIAMFIVLILPGIILLLCCLFWPLILVFEGAVTAYFSTMWTLAWREWTGATPGATVVPSGDVAS